MHKLWGGRFEKPPDELMARFNDSIRFDGRLYDADIRASIAYARALERVGLVTAEERDQLVGGLEAVREEFATGSFAIRPGDEDVHTAVERRLYELVGSVAGKLHTGRSRNDQVATDTRLYLREKIEQLAEQLARLQQALVDQAESHVDLIMSGYTHLQRAQPILYAHWVLSYFWKLQRDRERLDGVRRRVNVCPLGAGALAGNALGIDRQFLAQELGFDAVSENSLDAVADRDFVLEFLSWAAILGVHLSRLAEDLILYASAEFGFVELDEAYATGSSLMPQKKNPDSLELVRGKCGRLVGNLVTLLVVLKGLPSAYDKDLQEDKEPLFDTIDTLSLLIPVLRGVVATLQPCVGRMEAALDEAILATDLADYLVRRGLPFRESHALVGRLVRRAEQQGVTLGNLSPEAFREESSLFDADVISVFDFRRSVETRDVLGGTAPSAVRRQIERAKELLEMTR
jgi:argininosuccinate lyase